MNWIDNLSIGAIIIIATATLLIWSVILIGRKIWRAFRHGLEGGTDHEESAGRRKDSI